jgi:hypothetical protein
MTRRAPAPAPFSCSSSVVTLGNNDLANLVRRMIESEGNISLEATKIGEYVDGFAASDA